MDLDRTRNWWIRKWSNVVSCESWHQVLHDLLARHYSSFVSYHVREFFHFCRVETWRSSPIRHGNAVTSLPIHHVEPSNHHPFNHIWIDLGNTFSVNNRLYFYRSLRVSISGLHTFTKGFGIRNSMARVAQSCPGKICHWPFGSSGVWIFSPWTAILLDQPWTITLQTSGGRGEGKSRK